MNYKIKKIREDEFLIRDKQFDIGNRTFDFAVQIVNFVISFENKVLNRIGDQLLRSGTSVGANVEEGCGGISRKDFIHSMNIAKKESRETNYWLRIINKSNLNSLVDDDELNHLLQESTELTKILTSIVKTSQERIR